MQNLPVVRRLLLVAAFGLALLPTPAAGADTGIHYLYLIRHGAYEPDRRPGAPADAGLNALGHDQARRTGRRLASLPVHFTRLVSSPLRRAIETAADIGRSIGVQPAVDSLLRECTPTSDRADYMRNHSPAEIAECDSSLAVAWARYLVPATGGDRHDLLVCHANVIRWFVTRAVAADPLRWSALEIANGSLTILAVHPDGTVKLVLFSDVGHLPTGRQSWTGSGAGWNAGPRP